MDDLVVLLVFKQHHVNACGGRNRQRRQNPLLGSILQVSKIEKTNRQKLVPIHVVSGIAARNDHAVKHIDLVLLRRKHLLFQHFRNNANLGYNP